MCLLFFQVHGQFGQYISPVIFKTVFNLCSCSCKEDSDIIGAKDI